MNDVQSHPSSAGGETGVLTRVLRFEPLEVVRRFTRDERFVAIGEHRSECSMVGVIQISSDDPPDAWERHDGGDELLVLLSGRVEMTVRPPDGHVASYELSAGEALLIPAGVAHSGRSLTPRAAVLFVTPRAGSREWFEPGGEACPRS